MINRRRGLQSRRNGNGGGNRTRATQKPYTGHTHTPPKHSTIDHWESHDGDYIPEHKHNVYAKESPIHSGNAAHTHESSNTVWTGLGGSGPSHRHTAYAYNPHTGSLYGGRHRHFPANAYIEGYKAHKHTMITTGTHRHDPLQLPTSTQRSGKRTNGPVGSYDPVLGYYPHCGGRCGAGCTQTQDCQCDCFA